MIAFRGNAFAEPAALIKMIAGDGSLAKVRPDQRVVFIRDWEAPSDRLRGVAGVTSLVGCNSLACPLQAQFC